MGINLPRPTKAPPYPLGVKTPIEDIGRQSPKMFYTPDEIEYDDHIIKISFMNTSIVPPIAPYKDRLYNRDFSEHQLRLTYMTYEKVILKNSLYDYVYVQEGQKEKFLEMYLGIEAKDTKNKRYI
jgi:hypothetical protein